MCVNFPLLNAQEVCIDSCLPKRCTEIIKNINIKISEIEPHCSVLLEFEQELSGLSGGFLQSIITEDCGTNYNAYKELSHALQTSSCMSGKESSITDAGF